MCSEVTNNLVRTIKEISACGRAISGTLAYTLTARSIRSKFHTPKEEENFHFVFAHSDDELLVLNLLKIISGKKGLDADFTLLTNSSQGYEAPFESRIGMINSREDFARLRVDEFNDSLRLIGSRKRRVEPLLDERKIYELMVEKDYTSLHQMLDHSRNRIAGRILQSNPRAVFVDDFAGGHIIHDLANYITCCAAREINYGPVIEFGQYFLKKITDEEGLIILGDLGVDEQGRILREDTPGKYTPNIPSLGIKKGRCFLGISDFINVLSHRHSVYSSQDKTIERLMSQKVSYGVDAPRFREIDLATIDHTLRPAHGVLYEHVPWRQRGLSRLPTFDDFKALVQSYNSVRKY